MTQKYVIRVLVLAELTSHVDAAECLSPNHQRNIHHHHLCFLFHSLPSKTKPSGPFRKSAERIPGGHNRKVIPADDGLSALLAGRRSRLLTDMAVGTREPPLLPRLMGTPPWARPSGLLDAVIGEGLVEVDAAGGAILRI